MRDITCFALLDIYHAHDIKNHSGTSNLYRTRTFPFLRSYIMEDGVARNFSFRVTLSSSCRIHQFLRVLRLHSHVRKLVHSRLTFLPYFISSWLIFHGSRHDQETSTLISKGNFLILGWISRASYTIGRRYSC